MIAPFAPLYPWLRDVLGEEPLTVAEPDDPCLSLDARDRGVHLLDLRHGPTRYAVLRALADAGHARPWALGAPWSPLTDEQAGRATAAILRAVGGDPSKPAGVVPIAILDAYEEGFGRIKRRLHEALWYVYPIGQRFQIHEVFKTPHEEDGASIGWHSWGHDPSAGGDIFIHGPETGDTGRLAADKVARDLGCLFIEELTP